jgi:hypothetical protein
VELLWWEGCPSTERALAELRSAASEFGLDVALREIRTDEEAVAEDFAGSPTILIGGVELMTVLGRGDGGDGGKPAGLNCRVYHRRDGRVSPTPDPDDVRQALAQACGREQE